MKIHRQRIPHNPSTGHWGDCHRTAIAALLDLEPDEVPHYYDGGRPTDDAQRLYQQWAKDRGLRFIHMIFSGGQPLDQVLYTVGTLNPGLGYLLGGKSSMGCGHSVACVGTEIVCDPSGAGIVGPFDEDQNYWITFIGKDL